MAEINPMLTPKDVADILGVHYKTVHIWLREGRLKGIKISYRAWRIPQSALDLFIEQNSNLQQHNRIKRIKKNGDESGAQAHETSTVPSVDNHDTPQSKMKHYLRDIMGEHVPDKLKDI